MNKSLVTFGNLSNDILNCILGYLDGLGDAVEQGLVKAVGVSNYSGIISVSFFILMDDHLYF